MVWQLLGYKIQFQFSFSTKMSKLKTFLLYFSLLILFQAINCLGEEPVLASVTWNKKNGFQIVEELLDMEKDGAGETVAVANFTNAVNQTGWSYLEIKTCSDPKRAKLLIKKLCSTPLSPKNEVLNHHSKIHMGAQ